MMMRHRAGGLGPRHGEGGGCQLTEVMPVQQRACNYAEFRHSQYRPATTRWCVVMAAMYLCSQHRTPHVGAIHWVLFVMAELLCISVGVSAQKGRPAHLRLTMTLLWLVRNVWYSLVACSSQGPRNEEFFPSFATISSVASLLWSAVALIHLPKPYLLACIQACIFTCAYAASGLPVLTAAAQSGTVHALSILMYTVLDRLDRANYRAYLQSLQAAQGHSPASTPKQKTSEAGMSAAAAPAAEKEGLTQGACTSAGGAALVLYTSVPDAGLARGARQSSDQGACTSAAPSHQDRSSLGGPTKNTPPHGASSSPAANHTTSLDAALQTKHSQLSHAQPSQGASSAARAVNHNFRSSQGAGPCTDAASAAGRLQAASRAFAEPAYRQRIRKYQVVVKIHGALHPKDLPASALPDFVTCMQERMPHYAFGNPSIRTGCVLMSVDVYCLEDTSNLHSCTGAALQDWLHRYPAVLEQLPAAMPLILQVDGKGVCMEHDPDSDTWRTFSLNGSVPLPAQEAEQAECRITAGAAASPASPFAVTHPSSKQEENSQQPAAPAARTDEHTARHGLQGHNRRGSLLGAPSISEVQMQGCAQPRMRASSSVTDNSSCVSHELLMQQLSEAEAVVAESGCSSVTASSCTTPFLGNLSPPLMDSGRLGAHKCGGSSVAGAEPETL